MSSTNEDRGLERYPLPGVPTPILPADIANKGYVDALGVKRITLGNYVAAIEEPSHVFNFPAVDFDDIAYLELEWDLSVTAAAIIRMRINTLATGTYFDDGLTSFGGVLAPINLVSQTSWIIAPSIFMTGVNHGVVGVTKIQHVNAGTQLRYAANTLMNGCSLAGYGSIAHTNTTALGEDVLTDVEIFGSVDWQIGTRATLWSIARV